MSYEIGTAWLRIVPSFAGVVEAINAEATKWGASSGQNFSEAFKARVDAALKSLPDAKVGLDVTEADAKLAQIRVDLESLSGQNIGVDLSDTDAQLKLDALKIELDALAFDSPTIRVNVDAAKAELDLAALAVESDIVSSHLGSLGGGAGGASTGLESLATDAESASGEIGGLIPVLAVLGTALLPIGGLALGALSAIPALVGGAVTGGAAAYLGLSGILPALQAAAVANNPRATTYQINAAARALAGLTPAGRSFVQFVTGELFPAFTELKDKVQAALLPLFESGLKDLLPFFRDLAPFIIQAADGIGQTFDQLAKFTGSKTGLAEVNTILRDGNGLFAAFGGAFVTIFEAIVGIGSQATPVVHAIGKGLTDMANSFANWVSGGGFEKFLTWLEANGPAVVQSMVDLVVAAGKLAVVLTPVGEVVLRVVDYLARMVTWVSSSWQVFTKFSLVLGGVFLAISQLFDPVAWFIAAVILLGTGVAELVGHWREIWSTIEFLTKDAVSHIVAFFRALPGDAERALADFGRLVWGALALSGDWLETHIGAPIGHFFEGLPSKIARLASNMWHGISDAFKDAINTVIGWWDQLHFQIPGFHLGPIHFGGFDLGMPQIPRFHDGGVVQGASGVEQLAFLMPGEIVTPANKTPYFGVQTLAPIVNLTFNNTDTSNVNAIKTVVVAALTEVLGDPQRVRVA